MWRPYWDYEQIYSLQIDKMKDIVDPDSIVWIADKELQELNKHINSYLGLPGRNFEQNKSHINQKRKRRNESLYLQFKIGSPYQWWFGLYDHSNQLNGKLSTTMLTVDKALRDRAVELTEFYG